MEATGLDPAVRTMHTLPHPQRPRSVSSIGAVSLLIGVAIAPLAGCGGRPVPTIGAGPYAGPPLTIDSGGPQHRAVLTAPSAGWTFTLDTTRRQLDHTDVFVTIVRPDPAFMYTQALVTQEAGTGVDSSRPIELYARALAHGEKPADQPYNRAGASSAPQH